MRTSFVALTVLAVGLAVALAPGGAHADERPREVDWRQQFGTPVSDIASDVAVTGDGVYVVGTTSGSLGGPQAGLRDPYVRRYRLDGTVAWTRQLGGTSFEGSPVIGVGGGRVVIAYPTGSGPVETVVNVLSAATGEFDWGVQLDDGTAPGRTQRPDDVAVTPQGIYVVGTIAEGGDERMVVHALAPDRPMVRWVDQPDTAERDRASGVIGLGGQVYVIGSTRGTFTAPLGPGGAWRAVLLRYDAPSGLSQVVTEIAGPGDVHVDGVAAEAGVLYLAGSAGGEGGAPLLAAVETTGEVLWQQVLADDPVRTSAFRDVTTTPDGPLAIGIAETAVLGPHRGEEDGLVAQFSRQGRLVWGQQVGTAADDEFEAVAGGGPAYVAGTTQGELAGPRLGSQDAFVLRLARTRPDLWVKRRGQAWRGDDSYAPARQRTGLRLAPGRRAVVKLAVHNDGDTARSFVVRGCASRRGVHVGWKQGRNKVTKAVRRGRYVTPVLPPGGSVVLKARLRAERDARTGRRTCRVEARAATGALVADRVQVRVRVRR